MLLTQVGHGHPDGENPEETPEAIAARQQAKVQTQLANAAIISMYRGVFGLIVYGWLCNAYHCPVFPDKFPPTHLKALRDLEQRFSVSLIHPPTLVLPRKLGVVVAPPIET